jgi:hypothetical protein
MREKNIYDADSYLNKAGWALLLFSLFVGLAYLPRLFHATSGGLKFYLISAGFLIAVAGAVTLLIVAAFIRRDERRIIALWDILEKNFEVDVRDLTNSTSYTQREIERAIPLINAQPGAYFVLDRGKGRIVDGRLRIRSRVSDSCPSCGSHFSQELIADLSEGSSCPYCKAGLDTSGHAENKAALLNKLGAEREAPRHLEKKSSFNVGLMIALSLFFPPGALVYFFYSLTQGQSKG